MISLKNKSLDERKRCRRHDPHTVDMLDGKTDEERQDNLPLSNEAIDNSEEIAHAVRTLA